VTTRAHRRRERGLTLLEVLAATMIFALVMTVLVGTSTTAVHRSGLSARRLEAGLVADAVVADLEIGMRKRTAPVLERSEWKTEDEAGEEEYSIRVLNRPIQEALAAPATSVADEVAAEAGASAPEPAATKIGGAGSIGTLLAGDLPEVAKHLHQYDVEVAWVGVDGPESVTRTTFAFDWQAAQAEFGELFAAAGAAKDEEGADQNGTGTGKGNGSGTGKAGNGQTPSGGNPSSSNAGQNGRFVP
jgi:prepilin-type N-terminal cleavage/methylation domain-containing protein